MIDYKKDKLAKIIKDHRDLVNNGKWAELFSSMFYDDRMLLIAFLIENNINPLEHIGIASDQLKAIPDIMNELNDYMLTTNTIINGYGYLNIPSSTSLALLAMLLGFKVYKTDKGIDGTPDYIIAEDGDSIKDWYDQDPLAVDDDDNPLSFKEWAKEYHLKSLKKEDILGNLE